MTFDASKVGKVEKIIAALAPKELAHIADYTARLAGNPPPSLGTMVPPPPPSGPPPTYRDIEAKAMADIRYGDAVEFTSRGSVHRGTVFKKNQRTVGVQVGPVRWKVSPTLLRKVDTTPPALKGLPATPVGHSAPSVAGSGSW